MQRRRTITERQRVAFCFGRSRKAGKPYAAEGATEMERIMDVKNIPIGEIVPYERNAQPVSKTGHAEIHPAPAKKWKIKKSKANA